MTDVAGIADLPPLPKISSAEYNSDYGSDDLSDLDGVKGKAPISVKQTEFLLMQFAKRMGQRDFSAFNKWKKVWVAGFVKKKHRFIIWRQNRFKQLRDEPLHWGMAVADFLDNFETWLHLENFGNAECIQQQKVEMFLMKGASNIWEATKKGRQGNKQLATDIGEPTGKNANVNLPVLPNTTFMVVIRPVLNGINDQTTRMPLHASYADVSHWEELIDLVEQNSGPIEPYCLTTIYKGNLTQEELDKEYVGIYTLGQMMNDPLCGQISYNRSISHAFKLKLGHNVKLFLVEMKAATGKDIAEHVMRPAKVIPASLCTVSYAPLLMSILRLQVYLMKMKEWWMRRQVG